MYTVYVLRDKEGKLYKGMSSDMVRRIKEHRAGKTRTTSKMQNIEIVYKEMYKDKVTARAREKYFKTAAGRRFLKKVIERD